MNRDIVGEVRAVDDAFASLKGGRELDERVHDLIEGRAPIARERRRAVRRALSLAGAGALAVALFFVMRGPAEDVVASLTTPARTDESAVTAQGSDAPAEIASGVVRAARAAPDAPRTDAADALRTDAPRTDAPRTDALAREGIAPLAAPSDVARADVAVRGADVAGVDVRPLDARARARLESTAQKPALLTSVVDDPAAAMAHLKDLRARGAWADVLAFAREWETRPLDARTAETVSFEKARSLVKLGREREACRALASHVERFPAGADDAAALKARLTCD